MRGLCIDNINNEFFLVSVTIGKWYEILGSQNIMLVSLSSYFWICDDNGRTTVSLRSNFKTLDQFRDERLNEIL
jgi:hypothetical protein